MVDAKSGKSSKSIISLSADNAKVAIVAGMLKHPDDLSTLVAIRQKLAREKAIVDQQLKIGVQNQMEETREALDILGTTKEQVLGIRSNMRNIDALCGDAQGLIKDYGRIKKISQTHQNFVATQTLVNNLQELYEDLRKIEDRMESDRNALLGPASNLLMVHFSLHKLEELRDSTLYQARNEPLDVTSTLKKYFERLDNVIEGFNDYLMELSRRMLDLIQHKQGSVIVRVIKIIESEEMLDAKVAATTNKSERRVSIQGLALTNKKNEKPPRKVKSLRSRFFDVLHDQVSQKFKLLLDNVAKDPYECLDATTGFVFPDLELVYDELVPRTPSNYKIFPFFVLEYHRHIHDLTNRIVALPDLEGRLILHLLRFVREYYAQMDQKLGVTEELLEPQLLGGNEQGLLDEYLRLVRNLMTSWTSNLLKLNVEQFQALEKPPERDAGKYHMGMATDLYQMVNQQLEAASESKLPKVLEQVMTECIKSLDACQSQWKTVLVESKDMFDRSGFEDYVIAVTNDQIKCAEFINTIIDRIEGEPLLRPQRKVVESTVESLNKSMDGFFDVATQGTNLLLDNIFTVIKVAVGELYTAEWYDKGSSMGTIIDTLQDFSADYKQTMNDFMFAKMMEWMLERLVVAMIDGLRQKGIKLDPDQDLSGRLAADRRQAVNFFGQFMPPAKTREFMQPLELLHDFCCCTVRTATLKLIPLHRQYQDLPQSLIEDVVRKRTDFDRSTVKSVLEDVRKRFADNPLERGREATVFAKVKQ
ncbi:SNARE-binding exocyst subunit S6 [Actinomortierella ambigua]|uniref:SNARE-binding exocyst subunit S6 n=1 Tax=Actinomortierella ambigua TaxID=1343610 RepID=A0A9P6QK49_9FUNG|nr:SNARE-binding exocyst subunit S6 [Actinomortierella ambigua]